MTSHPRTAPLAPRLTTSPNGHYRWNGVKWVPAPGRRLGAPLGAVGLLVVGLGLLLALSVAIVDARDNQGRLLGAVVSLLG